MFIVTGAGNEPNIINGYPALYRSPTSDVQVPDLLVVGAVDSTGLVWWRTQQPEEGVYTGSYVEVYAPGSQVSCATSVGGIKPTGEGTSIGEILSPFLIAIINVYRQSECNCGRASCILKRSSTRCTLYRCFIEGRDNSPSMGKTQL